MFKQIDFVTVPVQDMARARAFYEGKLGLTASSVYDNMFVEYQLGGTVLTLGNVEAIGTPFAPVTAGVVALGVDDVSQAMDTLKAKGVEFPAETIDSGVCHMAIFHDSEGNALMLHHRYAPEK